VSNRVLISLDPGVRNIAVAAFEGGELYLAKLFWSNQPFGAVRDVCSWAAVQNPDDFAVEIPQVYRNSPNPKNLIDLAFVGGAVWGSITYGAELCAMRQYLPREWKGNQPKEATQRRVDAALSDAERINIDWPIKSLRHNVYDAIGIGLKHLGRY